jgi:SAM-dependent methyltransferase
MDGPADRAARAAFLAERRRVAEDRFDRLFAQTYDIDWGDISPTHAAMLDRLLAATVPGGEVLDAPCGTGKYWPAILASGHRVTGIDQSSGMLTQAARRFPDVPTRHLALQDLDDNGRFDAVTCIDAMEYVGPEDWPGVVGRLHDAAKPGAPIYLTVELPDPGEAEAGYEEALGRGEPVVEGEAVHADGGYHYFPAGVQVLAWLAGAGIEVDETLEGDHYLHVLGHRGRTGDEARSV